MRSQVVRVTLRLCACTCFFTIAHGTISYPEVGSRLAMMEYGNSNNLPIPPSFLHDSFTMTFIADVRGAVREVDNNANQIRGLWSYPTIVKLAYIAFLTGSVLPLPTKMANLNYSIWLVDECMDYFNTSVCNAPYAMRKFNEILWGDQLSNVPYPPTQATVGSSKFFTESAQVASAKGMTMVGYHVATDAFSNKVDFPTYMRTKPSFHTDFKARALYLRQLNAYTRMDTISCDTFGQRSNAANNNDVFRQEGFISNYEAFFPPGEYTAQPPEVLVARGIPGAVAMQKTWSTLAAGLKANNAHVHHVNIVLECPGWDIIHYLGLNGLVGSGHLWIGGDLDVVAYQNMYLTPVRNLLPYSINMISPYMFQSSCDGYIAVRASEGKYVQAFNQWVMTLEDKRADLFEPWLLQHIPQNVFANITSSKSLWWTSSFSKWRLFDAVWTLLLAVNSMANKTGSSAFTSTELYEEALQQRFEGLSGFVRFNTSASDVIGRGDRIMDFEFHQYRNPGPMPSKTCGHNQTTGIFNPALVASQCIFPPAGQEHYLATYGESLTIISDPVYYGGATENPPNVNKACLMGQSYDVVTGACNTCSGGTYNDKPGQASCDACRPGYYAKQPGASACDSCLQGTISVVEKSTSCVNCTAGTYAHMVQQSVCFNCTAGRFAGVGFENCVICSAGRYQNEKGQGECKRCGDLYPGSISNNGAEDSGECFCEKDTYYRPGGFGCTTCSEGLVCPQGRDIPTQEAGFYAEIIDTATRGYEVYECIDRDWCPAGVLATCNFPREGRSCARVGGEKCPFWFGLIIPVVLVFSFYGIYCATSKTAHAAKVSAWFLLLQNMGIVLSSMHALNVYLLLYQELPAELAWLSDLTELFMFRWQNILPECNIGQSLSARLSVSIFPPLFIVGVNAFNWSATNFLSKISKKITPMKYAPTWNCIGMLIQAMYIMQCKDALSFFAAKPNPCDKSTLRDFSDIVLWSDEHVAVGPALITAYLVLFYIIGTYAVLTYVVATAKGQLSNALFFAKWRFVFSRWRPECRYWACLLLLRNLCIALIPIVVRTTQLYQVLAFSVIIGAHALVEAFFVPWLSFMNNFFEIETSSVLMIMGVVGLGFTHTDTKVEKTTASVVMMCCVIFIWTNMLFTFGYAILGSSPKKVKKREEMNRVVGLSLLEKSAGVLETLHNDIDLRKQWDSFSKHFSSHDKRVFANATSILLAFERQDIFRRRMQTRFSLSSNGEQELDQSSKHMPVTPEANAFVVDNKDESQKVSKNEEELVCTV